MSEKITNSPQIRFAGFTDAWEQRKLSELLFPSDERNNAGKYTQNDVLAASLGTELVKKHIFFGLRSTEESVKNYRVVNSGDVIYTKSPIKGYPNGIIRTNKGLDGIVPSLYCVYHSIPSINSSIIQSYFEDKGRLDAYLYPLVNIGARNNVNITDLGFLEGAICISQDIEEQNKIVVFFNHLTNLITFHQRELELLIETKKSLLQKMFPKDGANVPEIRFEGFTDPWEQRELGKVVDVVRSYSLSRDVETDEDSGFRYVHYGDIHKKVAGLIESDEQLPMIKAGDYELLQKGDVIVADASEDYRGIAEPSVLLDTPSDKVVAGLHTIAMRPKEITPLFLYYLLHTDDFKKFGGRVGTGMKVFGITTKNLLKYPAVFPIKEEQEAIGKFFYELDHLITLHQSKLSSIKNIKKSLLQKMFV